MTRFQLRLAAVAALCVTVCGLTGCSGGGGALGLSGPQHKLLPSTKEFRAVTPAPSGPRELAKVLLPAHVVEPGDVLLVQPVELDAPVRISADQPVQPDGTIDLGTFGRPVVAGKTLDVIGVELNQLLKARSKEPVTLTVRIVNRASKEFYVLGAVNAPGKFVVTGRETALDAIVQAGGLTNSASEKNIILSRPTAPCGCRVVLPVCYQQIIQLGDTTTNYQIMPGDRIYVPSKGMLEGLLPDCLKKKTCDPCDTPQTLCPMDRPGCGTAGCAVAGGCAAAAAPAVPAVEPIALPPLPSTMK